MKKISTYIYENKFRYMLAIGSMIIAVALDLMSPQFTKHIVDDVIVGGQIEKLKYLLLGIFAIGVGRCIFQYIKEYTFDCLGSDIASSMRKDLFIHTQKLNEDFFDRTDTGELMSRIKDDIDKIWDGLSYVSMLLIEVVIHTFIVLFCMYTTNVKLAIIPTIAMIFCGIIAMVMERKLGAVYEEISEENAELNTVAEENLAGVRTVKAFAREKYEIKKFLSHNNRYYELNMKQSKVFVKYYPYFSVVTKILPLLTLLVGGRFAIDGELTLGSLSAMVEYSNNIVWPMEMLGWLTNSFSSAVASNRKIKKIYNEKPTIKEEESPVILNEVKGNIEFENVAYSKDNENNILENISFNIEPGKTLGIMGETGSGKTTIINLLSRFYDVTQGTIKLDGVDIKHLTLKQLRENVAVVMQDVFLFSDTISENIKLGMKDTIDTNEIKKASTNAQVSEFVEHMEQKYDTIIGERGVGLSGGQKQRISIARAFAKNKPILILDDSTSALDMETEKQIQKALEKIDATKIIIAHRISAVRKADEIIVLQDGKISERGIHEDFLKKKGLYYETYISQYGETEIN
ncbi:ABC transporter ATP-binding protein [uncultured Eubacterium sp.]|uniref:ABC transporter ATP-binding protein n=1 Tax=uncultured Eubacterium sp. TaxID=165185 RepID=UPI0025928FEC|nr:ABC transporter ATP-binding protein [uncultured Eubacterium sp.]